MLGKYRHGLMRSHTHYIAWTIDRRHKRAIKVYEKAGFVMEASFVNKRNEEERQFIIMLKPL